MAHLARFCRLALLLVSGAVVVWSFGFVGHRWWVQHRRRGSAATLTILYWSDTEFESRICQAQADRFEQLHPGVRIVRIAVQHDDFPTKLKTMFAAGAPPDLFYVPQNWFASLASMHLLYPLDDFVDRERRSGHGQWLDDIYPILMSTFRYDGHVVGKGPLLGIPKDCTTLVMWVNVDLFKRAGLRVPFSGWTWSEYEADMRKIAAMSSSDRRIYGGALDLGADAFRNLVWTFGGDVFGNNGTDLRHLTLDQPAAQQAMEMVRRVRLDDKSVYNVVTETQDLNLYQAFVAGDMGCVGPIGRWKAPDFRQIKDFTVDVVPVPYQTTPASQLYTTSWSMASNCRHPDEAFELVKFLCGPDGSAQLARMGLAIPALKSVANSDAFLTPGEVPAHTRLFLDAMKVSRVAQNPKQGPQWEDVLQADVLTRCLQLGDISPQQAAQNTQRNWLAVLDSPLEQDYPLMPWRRIAWAAVALVAGAAILLVAVVLLRVRNGASASDLAKCFAGTRTQRVGWLFVAPWIAGFAALTLGPMLLSLVLSFTKWTAMAPISTSQFLGLTNYRQLLAHDPNFLKSLQVTLYFLVLSVPLGQAVSLAAAVLLNNRLRGVALFRTAYFLPSVVSGVALATLWLWILNKDLGLLTAMARPLENHLHFSLPDWLGADAQRWAIPAFVLMGLWSIGSAMVIYIAGLKGIPASLYEAATIDGAGAASRFYSITLPMLSPLIFYNVVVSIIGSFQIFTQAKVMTNGGPDNATLFYVVNLYRQAFEYQNMGYASAMAWVLFLLVLGLTLIVFRAARNYVHYEGA